MLFSFNPLSALLDCEVHVHKMRVFGGQNSIYLISLLLLLLLLLLLNSATLVKHVACSWRKVGL